VKISRKRLELTQELHALVVDYWHDVELNWGRKAPEYYTQDGEFVGPATTYKGREKIRAFYKSREDRGPRTVVHSVINFQALPEGEDKATCHWLLIFYAADGKPVLPARPPIQIAYATDRMILDPADGWLLTSRRFEVWFEGGTPTANSNPDHK
jgi:hypothetical protein